MRSDTPLYDALSEDPTGTLTIREEYAQRLRGAYDRIITAIREAVRDNDVLGLENEALVTAPRNFSFDTDDRKLEEFERWLDEAQTENVLQIIERDNNRFIERAYEKGVRDADSNLRDAGAVSAGLSREEARQVVQMPTHERKLQTIFSRNFQQLRGITQAVDQQVSRELAEGIAAGQNPTEMARSIVDRVDKIGKTRATTLARTETINAHSSATIERYRQQGVEEVGIEPEVQIQTATDQKVCEQCADAAGRGPWTLDEFEGSEYQPPLHPNCRCSVIPIVD